MGEFSQLDIAPRFWELVDQARGDSDRMEAILHQLSKDDVARFYMEFRYATTDMKNRIWDIKDVPQWISIEVIEWIVSQGSVFCEDIYDRPEKLRALRREDIDDDCNFGGSAIDHYDRLRGGNPSGHRRALGSPTCRIECAKRRIRHCC